MCKDLVTPMKMLCGHKIDSLPTKVPDNCGGCGVVQKTEYLAETRKRTPCDDCQVANLPSLELSFRWMRELTSAAAWLEAIGLAHGDIRPPNILMDAKNHVKLCDFDRAINTGEHLDAGTEPFARLLGDEGGPDRGTYGKANARTEQLALGSILYSLTRGHGPYEDQWFGRNHERVMMDKLQQQDFPHLSTSHADVIIQQCWNGVFVTIKQMGEAMLEMYDRQEEKIEVKNEAWYLQRREECDRWFKRACYGSSARQTYGCL